MASPEAHRHATVLVLLHSATSRKKDVDLLLRHRQFFLVSLFLLLALALPAAPKVGVYAQNAAPTLVNCGGLAYTDLSQRSWSRDVLGQGTAVSSPPMETLANAQDTLIYQSARIFTQQGAYSFPCAVGSRSFIRLHFFSFPFSIGGARFETFAANFSVSADNVTLVEGWSPAVEAGGPNMVLMKEYTVVCRAAAQIQIVFTPLSPSSANLLIPSSSSSSPTYYALVNAIEFVPMPSELYGDKLSRSSISSSTLIHWNCGGVDVRPEQDKYTRTWTPDPDSTKATTSIADKPIAGCDVAPAFVPETVMNTFRVKSPDNTLKFPIQYAIAVEKNAVYFVRMLFSQFYYSQIGNVVMDLKINGIVRLAGFDIIAEVGNRNATWKDFIVKQQIGSTLFIDIAVNSNSQYPCPNINGLEVFKLAYSDLSNGSMETVPITEDANGAVYVSSRAIAIADVARILLMFKEYPGNAELLQWNSDSDPCKTQWAGAPCVAGEGVGLDLSVVGAPGLGGLIPPELGQISTLQYVILSNQHFSGPIPDSLGNLSQLATLSLDHNMLSGPVPATLGSLSSMSTLKVEWNSLSGAVPEALLASPSLTDFTYAGGNNTLCAEESVAVSDRRGLDVCQSGLGSEDSGGLSRAKMAAAVLGSIAGASALVGLLVCFAMKKRRENEYLLDSYPGSEYTTKMPRTGGSGYGGGAADGERKVGQRFSLQELRKATGDFDHTKVIGTGGFGNVYKGILEDGEPVAVKRGSPESRQGLCEFQTEIVTLSKLRHRHLVSLVGYCDDEGEMILVYEFMALGTLRGHLYGKTCGTDFAPLSWRKRLEICIGSARGLDYLHSGAQEMVIHRDVKSTNILLDDKYVAKVADFGLSKSGPSFEETHVSTTVKGSFGYMDPAYFKSQQLTEKSDVYSFGVVLLEAITARAPISQGPRKEQINLADWAIPYLLAGKVEQIVDPKLVNTYGTASLYKVAEVALHCLDEDRDSRPSMTDVRRGLEDALMLQDTSLSVVLDTPPAPMMCVNYDSEYHDYSNVTGASDPPSPPESLLMAR